MDGKQQEAQRLLRAAWSALARLEENEGEITFFEIADAVELHSTCGTLTPRQRMWVACTAIGARITKQEFDRIEPFSEEGGSLFEAVQSAASMAVWEVVGEPEGPDSDVRPEWIKPLRIEEFPK